LMVSIRIFSFYVITSFVRVSVLLHRIDERVSYGLQ
jgi:hypothetical protein